MNQSNADKRIALTNNEAAYTRIVIYFCVFIISYLYLRFFFHQPESKTQFENNPDHLDPFPVKLAILDVILCISFFLTVLEMLFLIKVKLFRAKVEYDNENLYITRGEQENMIPLTSIDAVRIINNFNSGVRGNYSQYRIRYSDQGLHDSITIAVYNPYRESLNKFICLVREKSPDSDTKNYSESVDWLVDLFKRKDA